MANGLARLFGLLCVAPLTRWLGPEPFGIYTLSLTFVGLASTFGLLGLDMAYTRYYLDQDTRDHSAVEAFCWIIAAAFASVCGLSASLLWLLITQSSNLLERNTVAIFMPILVILACLSAMAKARIRVKALYGRLAVSLAMASAGSATVSLVLAAIGIRGVVPLLLGLLASSAFSLLWLGIPPFRSMMRASFLLSRSKRLDVLRLGCSCAVTGPLFWLISSSDQWFLVLTHGDKELGIYSIASTLALSGIMVNSAVHLALFPEATRAFTTKSTFDSLRFGRLWEQLTLSLLVVMIFVGTTGRPLLRLLAASSFHGGENYIPFLASGAFFYGLAGLANLPFFLVGKMNRVAFIWGISSLFCLFLNVLLIPGFGGMGAALAQMLSYLVVSLLVLIAGQKLLPLSVRWVRLGGAVIISILALIASMMIPISNAWFELIITAFFSALLSIGLTVVVAPQFVRKLLVGVLS